MAKPDTAYTGGQYKHTQLALLIADSNLAVCRKFDDISLNGQLNFSIDPILRDRLAFI
jgi:hypothetical protein